MRTIWKYEMLPSQSVCLSLMIPHDAKVVHVGESEGRLAMWILLDKGCSPDALVERTFGAFYTGDDIAAGWQHCGTVQLGSFVWHVCERLGPPVKRTES